MMIEAKNITKVYKSGDVETQILKGVSLSIKEGEFVAIVGPSGSGKSTLMHILGCLDSPTSGQYFLGGQDVSSLSDEELADIRKKKIGFVFQAFNLLKRTSVIRNVMLPLIYTEVDREKRKNIAEEALRDSGLPETHFNHLSNQLSGGQMQRVAIARALINDPDLIFADEPTGNLDSKTGEIVLDTFNKLNARGKTIILITHERYIAERAKRVITIRDGEIVEDIETGKSKEAKLIKE
ncbi:MAG: ABC transporter ATP-binding protein [Candidatus Paceibacterota bacterium]|jgi:putative ABC transport system ATP-binding protein